MATYDSLNVLVNGVSETLYLQVVDWAAATVTNQSDIGMTYNSRAYLSYSPTKDPDQYFKPRLLGGYVEYDVDLSQQECNCIAALYAVSMPGKEADGSYHYTDDFAYCDANQVGGLWCPEFDLMEANKKSWAAIAHKCDAPNIFGHYSTCDTSGQCGVSVVKDHYSFGNGPTFTINTE